MICYRASRLIQLVFQYRQDGRLWRRHRASQHGLFNCFSATDVAMLPEMDTLHGAVPGLLIKRLMEWGYHVFGHARVKRLSGISVSHLCNLCDGKQYQHTPQH